MANEELIAALREADAVRYGEFELSHGGTESLVTASDLLADAPDDVDA